MENNEKSIYQINLRSVLITCFQEKWIILFVSLIFALLAFLYGTVTKSAYYVASTEIYIMDSRNTSSSVNYNDLQTAGQLTNDIVQLITNNDILEPVIDGLDLKMSINALKSIISVSAKEDTRIITISVTNKDPYLAADVANAVREQSSEKIVEITGVDAVNLVSTAKIPSAKRTSGAGKLTVFAFVFGLVLCFFVILAMDILNDTIKSPDEVIDKLGITTLGSIPYDKETYVLGEEFHSSTNEMLEESEDN